MQPDLPVLVAAVPEPPPGVELDPVPVVTPPVGAFEIAHLPGDVPGPRRRGGDAAGRAVGPGRSSQLDRWLVRTCSDRRLAQRVRDLEQPAPSCSTTRRPRCAGSSATCTTAPRPGWPRWRCTSGLAKEKLQRRRRRAATSPRPRARRRRPRAGQGGARRAARPGPGHPPAGARPRPRRRRWPRWSRAAPSRSELAVDVPERPAPAIESIAYFCAAELVTNVAQHSGATRAAVDVVARDDRSGAGGRATTAGRAPAPVPAAAACAGPAGVGRAGPRRRRPPRRSPARAAARRSSPSSCRCGCDGDVTGQGVMPAMRVVIAEDAAMLRDGLARLLEDRGHEVCAAVGRRRRRCSAARGRAPARRGRGRHPHAAHPHRRGAAGRARAARGAPRRRACWCSPSTSRPGTPPSCWPTSARRGRLPAQGPRRRRRRVRRRADPGRRRRHRPRSRGGQPAAGRQPPTRGLAELTAAGARGAGADGRGSVERRHRRDACVISAGPVEKHVASIFAKLGPAAGRRRQPPRPRRPPLPGGLRVIRTVGWSREVAHPSWWSMEPGTCEVWWASTAWMRPWHADILSEGERRGRRAGLWDPGHRAQYTVAAALLRLVAAPLTARTAAGVVVDRTCPKLRPPPRPAASSRDRPARLHLALRRHGGRRGEQCR